MKVCLPSSKLTHLLAIVFLLSCQIAFCQNVGINSTGATPNASAMLDIDAGPANNKGLLIPRVSLTGITDASTIPSPAVSLMVYNTNATMVGGGVGYWYWNGTDWVTIGGASGWSLTGNSFTNPTNNWIGTNDAEILQFKANGQEAGWIDYGIPSSSNGKANTFLGYQAGIANTTNSGVWNTAFGYQALQDNTIGSSNTAIGMYALQVNTSGTFNVATGTLALGSTTSGYNNTADGTASLGANLTGYKNTAMGSDALANNITGLDNTTTGMSSLYTSSSGSSNTADGMYALHLATTGDKNTAIGDSAGAIETTGNDNLYLGYNANPSAGGLTNATAIGYNAKVSTSNSMVLGNASVSNLYLPGYASTGAILYTSAANGLVGSLGTGSAGQVLTSAGAGAAPTWAAASGGSGWQLTGNAGTSPSTSAIGTAIGAGQNFVGTTDAKDFVVGTSDLERIRVTSAGLTGIGTTAPEQFVHIKYPRTVGNFGPGQTNTGLLVAMNNGTSTLDGQSGITIGQAGKQAASPLGWTFDLIGSNCYYDYPTDALKFYSGLSGGYTGAVAITLNADGLNNSGGTRIGFWTATNSTDPVERVSITATGAIGVGTLSPVANSLLAVKDGHLQSQQAATTVSIASTYGTQSLSHATDVAGQISVTTTAAAGTVTVTFGKSYTSPIVTLTPANATASTDIASVYVTTTTGTFVLNFGASTTAGVHTYNYMVIETQ